MGEMFVLKNIVRGTWLWSQEPDCSWYWRYRLYQPGDYQNYKRLVVTWPPSTENDYNDYYDDDDYDNNDNDYNDDKCKWKNLLLNIKQQVKNMIYEEDNYENTWSSSITNWLYRGTNLTNISWISPVFFVCEGPEKGDRPPKLGEKIEIIIGGIIRRLLRR